MEDKEKLQKYIDFQKVNKTDVLLDEKSSDKDFFSALLDLATLNKIEEKIK